MKSSKPIVGGQAVIDGVMMRCGRVYSVAVRKSKDKITVKNDKINMFFPSKVYKIPFIRGFFALIETLYVGIKTLNYSAIESGEEEEEQINGFHIFLSLLFAIVLAVGLFKFLPLGATQLLQKILPALEKNGFLFNLIEGIIKLLIFLIYLAIIGLMEDVKELFRYHGAEHKSVYCHESNLELNVENARKFSTLHPRCGTSFIVFILLLSILIYTLIPNSLNFWIKLFYRLLLLPIIAMISYEFLRLSGKHCKNKVVKTLISPGLFVQKITTKEPRDDQLEVAIKALKSSLEFHKKVKDDAVSLEV